MDQCHFGSPVQPSFSEASLYRQFLKCCYDMTWWLLLDQPIYEPDNFAREHFVLEVIKRFLHFPTFFDLHSYNAHAQKGGWGERKRERVATCPNTILLLLLCVSSLQSTAPPLGVLGIYYDRCDMNLSSNRRENS